MYCNPCSQGRTDDLLWKIAKCTRGNHRNISRNLTRLVYNCDAVIDIEMNYVEIMCRKKRPRIHDVKVHWPVLSMRSWCKFLFSKHPSLLLGGHRLQDKAGWQTMLQTFWGRYSDIKPGHDVYTSGKPLKRCIPINIHGDEGVSHRRVPFMVQSWQPVISWKGTDHVAVSGILGYENYIFFLCNICLCFRGFIGLLTTQCSPYKSKLLRDSFCSRLLYCCISASAFAGERTLRELNQAWTEEMLDLYENGFEARGKQNAFFPHQRLPVIDERACDPYWTRLSLEILLQTSIWCFWVAREIGNISAANLGFARWSYIMHPQ